MSALDWQAVALELRTNAQVRAMCAGAGRRGRRGGEAVSLETLRRWRSSAGFPAPVLVFDSLRPPLELWSAGEVEAWLSARARDAS